MCFQLFSELLLLLLLLQAADAGTAAAAASDAAAEKAPLHHHGEGDQLARLQKGVAYEVLSQPDAHESFMIHTNIYMCMCVYIMYALY